MGIAKEIFKNTFQNFLASIINRVGGLIFTILIARLLDPKLFGVYSLTLTIVLLILTFSDLGLAQTMIRYVSYALGKKNKAMARTYFKFLFNIKVFSTLLFSFVLFFLANTISVAVFKKPELILPIKASSLYLFTVSILDFITFTFYATKSVKFYTIKEIIFQTGRIILVPFSLIFLSVKFKIVGIFVILSIAAFLALLFNFYNLKKNYPFLLQGNLIKINKKRLLRFSFLIMVGVLPGVFFTYIDSLMLGAMLPVQFVGFYRVAYMISTSIGSLMMFNLVLFPFFTQLKGKNLKIAFKKVFHFVAILAFPISFGLALISEPFIKLIFGENYLPAVLPLYILSFIIIDTALFPYFTTLFQAKEKPEIPTKLIAISTILNIVLNLFLIRFFASIRVDLGMVGAALATFISRYSYGLIMGFLTFKQFKLAPEFSSIYKPLIASLFMSLLIILIPSSNIFYGILEIILASTVYFLILYLIKGIKKEDFIYLLKLIKNLK